MNWYIKYINDKSGMLGKYYGLSNLSIILSLVFSFYKNLGIINRYCDTFNNFAPYISSPIAKNWCRKN